MSSNCEKSVNVIGDKPIFKSVGIILSKNANFLCKNHQVSNASNWKLGPGSCLIYRAETGKMFK